jgi:hypothetical protein
VGGGAGDDDDEEEEEEEEASQSQGVWGGGVEMAAASHLKGVNVYVYQQSGGGYKRISCFEGPGGASSRAVRVLYGGGVHYDALELTNG